MSIDPHTLEGFKKLTNLARADERKSIAHYKQLLKKVMDINEGTIDDIMRHIMSLITQYGSLERLQKTAPFAVTRCEKFLNSVVQKYIRKTDKIREEFAKNEDDTELMEEIEQREEVIRGLFNQWRSNYVTPLIQASNVVYKPTDVGHSQSSFDEAMERMEEHQKTINPPPPETVSQSDIASGNF